MCRSNIKPKVFELRTAHGMCLLLSELPRHIAFALRRNTYGSENRATLFPIVWTAEYNEDVGLTRVASSPHLCDRLFQANPRQVFFFRRVSMNLRIVFYLCFWLGLASETTAQDKAPLDFARHVQPILAMKCARCHGPSTASGGVAFDTRERAFAETDSGTPAMIAGDPDASSMIERIVSHDESTRMPPEGKPLNASEIEIVKTWIREGANWSKHWAYRPLIKPLVPTVKQSDWSTNEVDEFVLAGLEESLLTPNAIADKRTLVRRAYYNLIGLPPTAEQVAKFENDSSADAWEKLIDKLLQSPQYGEHWGRKWLDVVRYAETNSFERDNPKPHVWRYRDYVIRSFNDDKPYDRFLTEQLAGDEVPAPTSDQLIATGFYRLGVWDDEPADRALAMYEGYDDLITTIGQGMLGLTFNCARCHDHKIDPIPQTDYYQLLTFLRHIQPMSSGGPNIETNLFASEHSKREFDAAVRDRQEQMDVMKKEIVRLEEIFTSLTASEPIKNEPKKREKNFLTQQIKKRGLEVLGTDEFAKYEDASKSLGELQREPPVDKAIVVKELGLEKPADVFVLKRGTPGNHGDLVEPGFPHLFAAPAPTIKPAVGQNSSGRRTALANWITSPDNLLTARVFVNRVWQGHFGRGIVRSSNNFGGLGTPPTHPELLDWLASDFVASGWKIKRLHKILMLSSAYRMSSKGQEAALVKDPANDRFWRVDLRRLSAEEIRDSLLSANGRLNPEMYGPSIYPTIQAEVLAGQSVPGQGWGKSSPTEQARRSVYIHVKRSLITPLLASFDFPETDSSCEARFTTTQPGQSFAMLNGQFANEQAAEFAKRISTQTGSADRDAQIQLAYQLCFNRPVRESELTRAKEFLFEMEQKHHLSPERALEQFCLLTLNLNEFVYLD